MHSDSHMHLMVYTAHHRQAACIHVIIVQVPQMNPTLIVLLQLTELLEGLWSKDDEFDVYKTEFIVVGPMDQFRQISTGTRDGTSHCIILWYLKQMQWPVMY